KRGGREALRGRLSRGIPGPISSLGRARIPARGTPPSRAAIQAGHSCTRFQLLRGKHFGEGHRRRQNARARLKATAGRKVRRLELFFLPGESVVDLQERQYPLPVSRGREIRW